MENYLTKKIKKLSQKSELASSQDELRQLLHPDTKSVKELNKEIKAMQSELAILKARRDELEKIQLKLNEK